MKKQAQFKSFIESTQEDWQIIGEHSMQSFLGLPDRVIAHLKLLDKDSGGFPVDRLTHSLQTATLAAEGGENDEYIVCALLHDIGDTLAMLNHADMAAVLLEPFVSEAHHFMVKNHGIFQGYYFFQHVGLDRNMREQFRDHPHFKLTATFCAKYDNLAFDPDASFAPLSEFEPLVRKVLAQPKKSIYLPEDDKVAAVQ